MYLDTHLATPVSGPKVTMPVVSSPLGPAQDRHSTGTMGRITRGLAANLAGNGITLLIQVVSVPVFLANWGVATYGMWLILSAVPTYLALSDLSFSTVAGNSMILLEATGNRTAAVALGRQVWSIVTIVTGAAVLATITIVLAIGGLVSPAAAIPSAEVRIVLSALFVQVAVSNQFAVLDAWYRTGGRYALGIAFRQIARLLEFGLLVTAVLLGGRPGTAAIAFLIGSVLGFGASWLALRRVVPWSAFRLERPRRGTVLELLRPGLGFVAFPLSNVISIQGFIIVVGSTLGAAAVVVFSTTRTVTRVALQIMMSINLSIWPELSRSIGSGRFDEARSILRRSVQLSLAASAGFALILTLFGSATIRWWTHGVVDPPRELLYILLLVMIANSLWFTLTTPLVATNQHTRMAIVYLVSSVAALLLAIGLSSAFGLPGAAIALLAIDFGMVVYVLPAALGIVHDHPATFIHALLDLPGAVRMAVRWASRS
jgi:O-antigen/teichoic acid export membrane protein